MRRLHLIVATIVTSWLVMQAVHELGHVLGACLTGGRVARVHLHPLSISRTDLALNPQPLLVVWSGPVFGIALPLMCWLLVRRLRPNAAFVARFFAGFCWVANGLYIGVGSVDQVGDCGDLLRHGAPIWTLWLYGILTVPVGFSLWHRQGPAFGWGETAQPIDVRISWIITLLGVLIAAGGWLTAT